MSVIKSYRVSMKPKHKKPKYYRHYSTTVIQYRDEDGIEKVKIIKKFSFGRYDVNNNEINKQILQDSYKIGSE